jgi:16S rRNA U516 pseudouridylate synthase RsuA-like enzyme
MDEILEQLNRVESQIATVKNKVAYRDLRRMVEPIDRTITEMSREDVNCRQLKKTTLKYRELEAQARDLLSNLEQMVTFAALISRG